ncbi:hypothetical protein OGAPHI_007029 [Ogataea philodendri]|uniref:Serine/threonine-protein phosphatase 2A activator n=1 Tax=Ogataea philodendri TaxID=1378263 RepID=A0A9P8NU77_9ASCO|nr:uncharacterized protein OGAPHI_007029 [Ogataea philodendri]KAH3660443.1 hypothetical protein OGAPHI_007029 [Ogataea philodendri]
MSLPRIPLDDDTLHWSSPSKKIYCSGDVKNFLHSVAIDRIKSTLLLICQRVSLKNIPEGVLDRSLIESKEASRSALLDLPPPSSDFDPNILSTSVQHVIDFIAELNKLVDQTPPFPGPRRYGNMACRDWHDKLNKSVEGFIDQHLKPKCKFKFEDQYRGFVREAKYYILGSFGSRERLDYGTGHELSFMAFISSLLMCDILDQEVISGQELLTIFGKYYDLVKRMILTYTLEPAGSHGVWGLDDHFHLIYIIGSYQLVDFQTVGTDQKSTKALNFRMGLTPSAALNPTVIKQQCHRNLYFNAMAFVRRVKKGQFSEHSPLLYDISSSKTWEKIAQGLIKMYYGEVLSKFPVVQHFYFGEILFPWKDSDSGKELPESSPEAEAEVTTAPKLDYRSEAESAMHSMYQRREEELAKLIDKRPQSLHPTTRAPWK